MRSRQLPTLNDRIRVQRRSELLAANDDINWDNGETLQFDEGDPVEFDEQIVGDEAGNFEGDWVGIGPAVLRAHISELRGGEEIIAAKLRGVATCLVVVRSSRFTRSITTDDRFVVEGEARVLNVRHAPPPGREAYITFVCESGVTT